LAPVVLIKVCEWEKAPQFTTRIEFGWSMVSFTMDDIRSHLLLMIVLKLNFYLVFLMVFFLFWHIFVWIIGFLSDQHSLYSHLPRFGVAALLLEVMDNYFFVTCLTVGLMLYRMMSDYNVETINDGLNEFNVEFQGPKESIISSLLVFLSPI
jgi:hypothetical protein